MTPLLPAPPPVSPQPLPASSRGGAQRPPGEDSFALLLEQGPAAVHPSAADAHGELELPLEDLEAEPLELLAATPEPPVHPLQPTAPWPPAGLAGLQLSAADGEPGPGSAPLRPSANPLPPAAPDPATASVAAARPTAAPGPDLLAITGLPPASRAAAPDHGSPEPTPDAFALPPLASPAPAPVRDAAPMLAAQSPTPDVRAGDFSEKFGAQLQWMAGQQIGHARIRVSPQELGPVEVLLRLDGERISADFISSHPETRQALEQGLPRLRDLLGEHGFQLAHADVGQHSSTSPESGGHGSAAGAPAGADPGAGDTPATPDGAAPAQPARGLIDAYA